MGSPLDLVGKRFGRLVVLKRVEQRRYACGYVKRQYLVKCDCGKRLTIIVSQLTKQHSCGCVRNEQHRRRMTKHGLSRSIEYVAWRAMISRCERSTDIGYPNYGGRGIKVCPKWRNKFAAFYKDLGPRPSPKHSLDRIDNDGNYKPGNVRWAKRREQAYNRRSNHLVEYRGEKMPLKKAWRLSGEKVNYYTALDRITKGWAAERAFARI